VWFADATPPDLRPSEAQRNTPLEGRFFWERPFSGSVGVGDALTVSTARSTPRSIVMSHYRLFSPDTHKMKLRIAQIVKIPKTKSQVAAQPLVNKIMINRTAKKM
jgi:hypothetical protein